MNKQIRGKIVKYVIAPVANAIILILLAWLIEWGFLPRTTFWGFVTVLAAGYVAGIPGAMASAVMYTFFSYAVLADVSFWRFVNIAVGGFGTGYLVGYLRQRDWDSRAAIKDALKREKAARLQAEYNEQARNFVEGLNGNIALLQDVINQFDSLLRDVDRLNKDEIITRLRKPRHDLVQLLTSAEGWQQIAMIKDLVKPGKA